jgi:UDP-N-acetylglucosamine 2-epimerase (non-hydrolysing)
LIRSERQEDKRRIHHKQSADEIEIQMYIGIILGTRPEIIKMAPVIRALSYQRIPFFILHTGQHYSFEMDGAFFDQLKIDKPKYNLSVGSGSHALQTGKMIIKIEEVLLRELPDTVLLQGDTNTVLAGALAASKLHILVGHVEAGLRSYDKNMPEEINRMIVDHISDYLFAPTANAQSNLIKEGLPDVRIFVTGNTIVDSLYENLSVATSFKSPVDRKDKSFVLATVHREENVEEPKRLKDIIDGLVLIAKELDLEVVFPVHPRTKNKLLKMNIQHNPLTMLDPLDYFSFLKLESKAALIVTDSGGVQEEACILHTPCITVRDNTERPETVEVGANIVSGTNPQIILKNATAMLSREKKWRNPFGNGRAAQMIVSILLNLDTANTPLLHVTD